MQPTVQKIAQASVSKMWFHPRLSFWLLALLLLLPLAGCSEDREQVARQGIIKACSLITGAEMQEITGRPMKTPEEKINGAGSTCVYVSSDEPGKGGAGSMISFALLASSSENNDADTAYSQYIASLKKNLNMEMTEIQGIGQRACWNEGVRQLTAFSGRYMLILSAGTKEQGDLDTCRRVMAKALARLPE